MPSQLSRDCIFHKNMENTLIVDLIILLPNGFADFIQTQHKLYLYASNLFDKESHPQIRGD